MDRVFIVMASHPMAPESRCQYFLLQHVDAVGAHGVNIFDISKGWFFIGIFY